jgi:uncharacterized protein (TIGR02757 family)
MNIKEIEDFLNKEVKNRNLLGEISEEKPDPLLVVYNNKDEYSALICSMFAYGRASMIVKFLKKLDFSLLDENEKKIENSLNNIYYRLQSNEDVKNLFISLNRLKKQSSLEDIFYTEYEKKNNVIDGISNIIKEIYKINPYNSRGYSFLIGPENVKLKGGSAYKRWNLFLRWMVRKDNIDLGLWTKVDTKDLIIPLDTHLHTIGLKLGLLKRTQADLASAIELTKSLKKFDETDPLKYDLAIYRLGQEKLL